MKKLIVIISLLSMMGLGTGLALADTASVVNNVSVTANSGGNTETVTNNGIVMTNSSSVSNGQSSASVRIEQSVNGVAQPPIDIATTTSDGSISVHVNSQVKAAGSSTAAVATTSVVIGAEPVSFIASLGSFFANLFTFLKFKL